MFHIYTKSNYMKFKFNSVHIVNLAFFLLWPMAFVTQKTHCALVKSIWPSLEREDMFVGEIALWKSFLIFLFSKSIWTSIETFKEKNQICLHELLFNQSLNEKYKFTILFSYFSLWYTFWEFWKVCFDHITPCLFPPRSCHPFLNK